MLDKMDVVVKSTERLRRLFYLVTPNETSFKEIEDVPKYVDEAIPFFVALMILEIPVLLLQGKNLPRFNDGFSSIAAGLLSLLHGLLFRSVELATYIWTFERINIIALPWDSPITWVLGFLGVDFGYYWVHRCGHGMRAVPLSLKTLSNSVGEQGSSVKGATDKQSPIYGHKVNILWSGHQAHHSSEDYNLTTALRQSAILRYFTWMFYLPLAVCVPPSIFLVHSQFNLLYQFWIHTETVNTLGPLEWILNTPSHHRVHHGRNPYCIDKNYGGTLIIFDRIFGTFQAESEEVIYGLVHSLNSWDPIYTQLCHLLYMIGRFREEKGLVNKLSVILKGPGWSPGKPWTGVLSDIPEVEKPVQKYDRNIPLLTNLYVWCHFGLLLLGYILLSAHKANLSSVWILLCIVYTMVSLTSFGSLYDHKEYAQLLEVARCVVVVVVFRWYYTTSLIGYSVFLLYIASVTLWTYVCVQKYFWTNMKQKSI